MTLNEKIKKGLNRILDDVHTEVWHYHPDFNFGEVTLEAMKEIRAYLDLMIQRKEQYLSENSPPMPEGEYAETLYHVTD